MSRPLLSSHYSLRAALLVAALGLLLGACSKAGDSPAAESGDSQPESEALDHTHHDLVLMDTAERVQELFPDGEAHFERRSPFKQLGFFFRTNPDKPLQWKVRYTDGKWSDWAPVEVTWTEDDLHVGRVILESEAMEVKLRGAEEMTWAQVSFYKKVVANTGTLARDLPFAEPEERSIDGLITARQGLAPSDMVISRSEWGARNPNKVCWGQHTPDRMSIHHTFEPATDGADAAAAMRGMQAYHIDSNGWCDIGYHFVVSQAGKIYQGLADEQRYGAHVGGQNTGNIGICLIGNFEPGYATTRTPSTTQLKAAGRIVGWVSDTYNIPLNRNKVMGHRENPGQSTNCPGSNLLNKFDKIFEYANPEPLNYDISAKVKLSGLDDFYTKGSSKSVKDALPGDKFKAEIIIKNKSEGVIRGVWGGYAIPEPFLKATNYKIYSDHPKYDGKTWVLNDADEEPDNPGRSSMGKDGKFNLNAFSPNESKRILVDLEATQYSIDADTHADIQAWLHKANSADETLYDKQSKYDGSVSTNKLGGKVQAYARVDVFERDFWRFDDTRDSANLEGWTGAPEEALEDLKVNTSHGLMAAKVAEEGAQLIAPDWAEINADQYDQLVLSLRAHDGAHTVAIYWASGDDEFSDENKVEFEAPGDGEMNTLVVDLSAHPQWQGKVSKLRIDPLVSAAPGEDDSAWYDFDEIFFQSSSEKETSAPGLIDFVDQSPVQNGGDDTPSPDPSDPRDPGGSEGPDDPGAPDLPDDPGGSGDSPGQGDSGGDEQPPRMQVNSNGCSASGNAQGPSPLSFGWALLVGGALFLRRRRG